MLYLGIDMHSKWFTLAGFDKATGELFQRRKTENTPAAMAALFADLPSPRCGAMESGTNAVAMHRLLAPYFQELIIVAPHKVWDRQHNKTVKTDHRDALALAEKLARKELTPVFVPTDDLREWRTLGRARIQTTQLVTQVTNQLYALLRGWGYLDEKSLLSKAGRTWMKRLTLPALAQQVLDASLTTLETLQQREMAYEEALTTLGNADPICQLLRTIPYVGPFTAFILRAEIGDIARFATADALIAYSGLAPRVFQSGDHCRYGALTKVGNVYLRYVAVLLAQNAVKGKQDTPFKRRYYRLAHTHELNEIKVMLARDFLAVVHSMWRHQTPWHDQRRDLAACQPSVA
jgi:transposase